MEKISLGITVGRYQVINSGPRMKVKIRPIDPEKSSFVVEKATWVLKCNDCSCQFLYTEGKDDGMIDETFVKHTCEKKREREKVYKSKNVKNNKKNLKGAF